MAEESVRETERERVMEKEAKIPSKTEVNAK